MEKTIRNHRIKIFQRILIKINNTRMVLILLGSSKYLIFKNIYKSIWIKNQEIKNI